MDFKNWLFENNLDNTTSPLLIESKKELDSIKYGRTTEERHLRNAPTPFFGNDWKKWTLNPPPKNSSKITKKELKFIVDKNKNLDADTKKIIRRQDTLNPEVEFFDLLKNLGEKLSKKEKQKITKIMEELTTISLFFKEHFDRPRPHQLLSKIYPKLPALKTETGTAAYPSAHAMIGEFLGSYLSDLYPQHKKELKRLGKELGIHRVLGGFHFPSDVDTGITLAKKLYSQLKN